MRRLLMLAVFFISSMQVSSLAAAADVSILQQQCASCHNITGPASTTLAELWQKKGPDLFYAGNKYRKAWLESWLQNPKRIRPAGMFYMNHIKPGTKRDMVDKSALKAHVKLGAADAKTMAKLLRQLKVNSALIKAETHDASISPGPLGEMMFDKMFGCMACHQIEPGFGGLSGSEIYTAGKRLRPEFMLSYIRSPQAWGPKIWMPNTHLSDRNIQKLVNYIIVLSKENFDE